VTEHQDDLTSLPADPEQLAGVITKARTKFLQIQKLILTSERAEQRIRTHGKDPGAELAGGREQLDDMLDQLSSIIGRAQALLAARATADGGDPLTAGQAKYFLLAIGASAASLGLYDEAPDHMTAMLNRLLTQIDGPFETRTALIARYMRKDDPAGAD
jgi:hypothetical protein